MPPGQFLSLIHIFESQDHACANGGEVPHRNWLFHHDAVQRFEAHTGRHRNARDQQCPRAENKRAGHQCGQQRDTHVEHKPPRAGMVGDMGGCGNDQFFAFHRYLDVYKRQIQHGLNAHLQRAAEKGHHAAAHAACRARTMELPDVSPGRCV